LTRQVILSFSRKTLFHAVSYGSRTAKWKDYYERRTGKYVEGNDSVLYETASQQLYGVKKSTKDLCENLQCQGEKSNLRH